MPIGLVSPVGATVAPASFVLTMNGVPLVGVGEEGVLINPPETEGRTIIEGIDGAWVAVKNLVVKTTGEIHTIPMSPSEIALSTYYQVDQLTGRGGFVANLVDGHNPANNFTGMTCFVQKPPAYGYNKNGVPVRKWPIVIMAPQYGAAFVAPIITPGG